VALKSRDDLISLKKRVDKELEWVHQNIDIITRDHLQGVEEGSLNDVNYIAHSLYYRWLAALIRVLHPLQVIELGSAGGTSLLMMLSQLPKESKLYSCTIPEPEGEWRFIKQDYPQLIKVLGDDLDLSVWPKGTFLDRTDIWFLDTEHNYDQVHAELELYDKFFKPGSLVLIDDILLNDGMRRAWKEIKYPKLSMSDLHWSGFGCFCVP
jgi:predicted O-methyltransferase YrrM